MEVRRRVSKVRTLSHHAANNILGTRPHALRYYDIAIGHCLPVVQPLHHVCLLGNALPGGFFLAYL